VQKPIKASRDAKINNTIAMIRAAKRMPASDNIKIDSVKMNPTSAAKRLGPLSTGLFLMANVLIKKPLLMLKTLYLPKLKALKKKSAAKNAGMMI